MELRQLQYFHALSEELHFGRAAARAQIGQPALSLQISKLERELGVRLFDRTSRSVRLTRAGTMIVGRARLVLKEVEALLAVAETAARGGRDSVRLGCIIDTGAYRDLLGALDSFGRESGDDVELDLHSDHERAVLEGLRNGALDIGITWLPPALPDDLDAAGLLSERLIAAVADSHPLAGEDVLTAKVVASEPLVLPPRAHTPSFWNLLLVQLSSSAGTVPQVAWTEPTPLRMLEAVGRGRGVALLPEALAISFDVEGVTYVPCEPQLSINLGVLWRTDSSPLVQSVVDHLRKTELPTPPSAPPRAQGRAASPGSRSGS
jgi:LysR family transcriptional regulator, benzoate and cis,cis-muconate-responsive activator of ben and cat genes